MSPPPLFHVDGYPRLKRSITLCGGFLGGQVHEQRPSRPEERKKWQTQNQDQNGTGKDSVFHPISVFVCLYLRLCWPTTSGVDMALPPSSASPVSFSVCSTGQMIVAPSRRRAAHFSASLPFFRGTLPPPPPPPPLRRIAARPWI